MRLLGALLVHGFEEGKRKQGPCGPGPGELVLPKGHIPKEVNIIPPHSAWIGLNIVELNSLEHDEGLQQDWIPNLVIPVMSCHFKSFKLYFLLCKMRIVRVLSS